MSLAVRLGLATSALAFAFAFIGTRGLWETDEGRYVAVATKMVDSGDWLTPRLNLDDPHLTKPPLTYWVVASAIATFGRHEWAARLPNAFAYLFSVWLVWRLARRIVPARPELPVLVFASMPYVVLGANVVTTDMLLATFELAAVTAWFEAWQCGAERRRLWLTAMWVAFGLAFMTKGPPGLLPLLPIAAFTAFRDDAPRWRALFAPRDVATFVVIGFAWFAVMVVRDPRLLDHFMRYELVARLASGSHGRNPEWYAPFTVYLPILLLGFLPWNLVAPTWLRRLPALFTRSFWRERLAHAPPHAFLLLWVLLPLLAFCLARSRQWSYLLPLSAPIALLLGAHLAARVDLARLRWRTLVGAALLFPLALKLGLAQWSNPKDARRLAAALQAETDLASYERIVFDRHWPYWGLVFYVAAPVGHIEKPQFAAPSAGVSVRTDRCAETAKVERRELWISAARRAHEFRRDLATCDPGLTATHLGQYLDMVFFEVARP